MRILAPNRSVVEILLTAGYEVTPIEGAPFAYETNAELKLGEEFPCGNAVLRMVREDGLTHRVATATNLKQYGLLKKPSVQGDQGKSPAPKSEGQERCRST